jgi:hypothetical protein
VIEIKACKIERPVNQERRVTTLTGLHVSRLSNLVLRHVPWIVNANQNHASLSQFLEGEPGASAAWRNDQTYHRNIIDVINNTQLSLLNRLMHYCITTAEEGLQGSRATGTIWLDGTPVCFWCITA